MRDMTGLEPIRLVASCFFAGFCKYQKVDFLDYFVTGSLQSLLCLLKVFSLHQYVVGVIG